jgi:hypothetical protein
LRTDEVAQLKEQKKHLLAEMRSMASRYDRGGAWAPEDNERYDYCYRQASEINEKLEANHQQELEEIRSARAGGTVNEFKTAGFERSNAPEPLYEAFRSAGFARGEPAEIPWTEFRAITWTGSVDNLNSPRKNAGYLGYDTRYAYQALPSVGVDAGVTSISLLTQTARTLATPANVIRAIDAVTAKPETTETLTVATVSLKQLASVVSDVPNIFLENNQAGSIIENDLKLAITDALDDLVRQAVAASGFQAPGADPLLVSIRKAMSSVMSSGYSPDTLILRPADAETLDTLRTSGSEAFYVFAAGNFAPSELFGLRRYISKTVAAPIVMDASAFGKLYASPLKLQTFEQDAGQTNKSRVRIEMNAQVGVERQAAAVRIAAS